MTEATVLTLRLYGELNDLVPPPHRQRSFMLDLEAPRSVKDLLESIGVPHPEVGLILVDGRPVDFGHPVKPGERISAYPRWRKLSLPGPLSLRSPLPARPRFLLDVHLGQLARDLRMLGFDAVYLKEAEDQTLAILADLGHRVLLTRDLELLKRKRVRHGRYVRATAPADQLFEIMRCYDLLDQIDPLTRCLRCNTRLRPARPAEIKARVPAAAYGAHSEFRACAECESVYWAGSHVEAMLHRIAALKSRLSFDPGAG